jgi:hypothetical protein
MERTESSATDVNPEYSGTVAIVLALSLGVGARTLFEFAEAGPASSVVALVFPLIILAAVFFTARYALRAFGYYRASGKKTRSVSMALIVAALGINTLVVLFALFVGFMMVRGPIVP